LLDIQRKQTEISYMTICTRLWPNVHLHSFNKLAINHWTYRWLSAGPEPAFFLTVLFENKSLPNYIEKLSLLENAKDHQISTWFLGEITDISCKELSKKMLVQDLHLATYKFNGWSLTCCCLLSKQCSWYIGYNWWLIGWSWLLYQILHHYKPIFSCLP
jgi:hypothetical protein